MTDLRALAADRGVSLAELSRRLDRNVAYLQQHVARGTPRRLDADDSYVLARLLGVDQRTLGAREPWRVERSQIRHPNEPDCDASLRGSVEAQ